MLETTDQNGNELARYADTLNVDEPLSELVSGTTSFYDQDGLASVTSLTNGSGAAANTYTYDSFGKLTASSGTLTNPFQFTGRDYDSETGLRYYRARYYDPSSGHFLSQDPARFWAGTDFYSYVDNDPLDFRDPLGLCPHAANSGTTACGLAVTQGVVSIVFDFLGAIPGLGNVVSAGAAGARVVNGIVAYGGAAYGIATGLPDEAPYGAASASAGLGLALADAALEGGKVIPGIGNALSIVTLAYDSYQLGKTVRACTGN